MSKLIFFILIIIAFGFIGNSIFYQKKDSVTTIQISGSSTLAPLISEIAESYESENKNVKITVQSGGSSKGISDVRRSLVDVGMVSRKMKPSENDLTSYPIASDSLVIILNKDNPISLISFDELIKIYRGEISNWSYFDDSLDQSIVVINKAEGRSTLDAFLKYTELDNRKIRKDIVIGDNQQGIKTVIGNRYSIGYVSSGTARYSVSNNENIKILSLIVDGDSGEKAELRKFANRQLNLVVGNASKEVDDFIEYCRSKVAYGIIEKHYFDPF